MLRNMHLEVENKDAKYLCDNSTIYPELTAASFHFQPQQWCTQEKYKPVKN